MYGEAMNPIWTGTISFGLVNIPISLYSATKQRRIDFDYLRKDDLCPVGYRRVCKNTGEEVPYKNIVRGYEYRKGQYVVLTKEDFEQADVRKTYTVEILDFTEEDDVKAKYYQKPYFVASEKGGDKGYVLLRDALRKSGKVGIARYILKTREHLGVLSVQGDYLILNQIRFESEMLRPTSIPVPKTANISEEELETSLKLIEGLSDTFNPEKYHDTYTEELKEVIAEKAQGRKAPRVKEERLEPTEITEILKNLRESIDRLEKRTSFEAEAKPRQIK